MSSNLFDDDSDENKLDFNAPVVYEERDSIKFAVGGPVSDSIMDAADLYNHSNTDAFGNL
jgi:hypothetical protein